MEKRMHTGLLIMMSAAIAFFLVAALPLGLSSTAYATPDQGKNCSQCHGSNKKGTPKGLKGYTDEFMMERCNGFSSTGSNPYFVLEPGVQLILEGKEKKEDVKLTITVLDDTMTIHYNPDNPNDTAEARVVEERETRNGVLAEVSRNYFAICDRTNSVFYFGEDVDIYENGQVVSHEGAWKAGTDGARAGVIMPGVILLGGKYFQEVAPGVALDRAEIVSMGEAVQTPARNFTDCLKTKETSALERGTEYKFYAPGIGVVKDAALALTSYILP